MGEKMTHINPDVLVWARKRSHSSILDVKKQHGKIEEWEAGLDHPTYAQLESLSKYYRCPTAVFFFPEPPSIEEPIGSCRTLPSEAADYLSRDVVFAFNRAKLSQLALYEIDYNPISLFSEIADEFNSFTGGLSEFASILRSKLGVSFEKQIKVRPGSPSFKMWRDALWKIGIVVMKEAINDSEVSGFCLYDSKYPVIVTNSKMTYNRQIFTLFHEICHLLHVTSGIDFEKDIDFREGENNSTASTERVCNRFAADFLIPQERLMMEADEARIDLDFVISIAHRYSVSPDVVLRSLFDSGSVARDSFEKWSTLLHEQAKMRPGRNEGENRGVIIDSATLALSRKGSQFTEVMFEAYYTRKISLDSLSSYLDLSYSALGRIAEKKNWSPL